MDVCTSPEEKWPSIASPAADGVDDSVPETRWPSIASALQTQEFVDKVLDAEDHPSEWPSIVMDNALDLSESTVSAVVQNSDDPAMADGEQMQEVNADQVIASFGLDQSSKSDTPSPENLNFRPSRRNMLIRKRIYAPDLSLRPVENENQLNDSESSSDQLASADSRTELGELRFVEDDD